MKKIAIADIPLEHATTSPRGRFASSSRHVSRALGHVPGSDSKRASHPFEVEWCSLPPHTSMCPYHAHSAQSEFYAVISGRGQLRSAEGLEPLGPGDAAFFAPGEPHQIINDGDEPLVLYIIADDPVGDTCYYPDSDKWALPDNLDGGILKNGPSVNYYLDEEKAE